MKINAYFAHIPMQIKIPAHVTAAIGSQEVPESQFD
jgi:hypothetical protein